MTKLIDRITQRNKEALDVTIKILDDYSVVFDDVFDRISHGSMTAQWVSIDFHRNTKRLLDIIGLAQYKEGEMMTNEFKEVIYIDSTNVDYYKKPMRVILPIDLVEDADIEALDLFVKEYSEFVLTSSQDEMDLMVADDEFLKDAFTCFSNLETKRRKRSSQKKYRCIMKDLMFQN